MLSHTEWHNNLLLAQRIVNAAKLSISVCYYHDEGLDLDGWVTIRQEDREIKTETIANTITETKARFIVEVAIPVYNYPSEPDDVDIVEVSDHASIYEAIKAAIMAILDNHLDNIMEGIAIDVELNHQDNLQPYYGEKGYL